MKLHRIRAVARKEFIHIWRDPRSLGMAIAIPMLLLVLFGFALTLDVENVPLVVWDQSGTAASREFTARFSASRYFSVRAVVRGYPEVERAIDASRAMAAIVIPGDFADALGAGRDVAVQCIVDGSDANTATIALGYARIVTREFNRDIRVLGTRTPAPAASRTPVAVAPRVWFNSSMESRNFIIPGLIAVIMMVIAALLTSLTVAREWERGTMETLISTPVRAGELILGKLLPYFAIGMVDVLLAVLMGQYLFGVPLRGSVALLFAMAAVFLAGALSVGMVISIVTKSQLLATQMAMVTTFLPAFLLSGFMVAIGNMPVALQVITHIVPARYFVTILRGIYLKGIGLRVLAGEALFLLVFTVLVMAVAHAKFRKKVGA